MQFCKNTKLILNFEIYFNFSTMTAINVIAKIINVRTGGTAFPIITEMIISVPVLMTKRHAILLLRLVTIKIVPAHQNRHDMRKENHMRIVEMIDGKTSDPMMTGVVTTYHIKRQSTLIEMRERIVVAAMIVARNVPTIRIDRIPIDRTIISLHLLQTVVLQMKIVNIKRRVIIRAQTLQISPANNRVLSENSSILYHAIVQKN